MTGPDLKSIRAALAAAIGHPVSQDTLGRALGLSGDHPARTARRWEDEDGPTGPAAVALTYMAQGALDETMQRILPEYVEATALPDADAGPELVIRLWWPRFVAVVTAFDPALDHPGADWAWIERGVERLVVAVWIDDPQAFGAIDPVELVRRAASLFQESSLDAIDTGERG